MKKIPTAILQAVHVIEKEWLNPYNPIIVNLIGAGGTGGQVLTALARINHALITLNHPGLFVRVFDDDKVDHANLGRQLFTTGELGQYKAVALIDRINRFFGTSWKAVIEQYSIQLFHENPEILKAGLTISCVDTVQARFEIASVLENFKGKISFYRDKPLYHMDFGNSRFSGQVVLSTVNKIVQPAMKKFRTVDTLPMVTEEFADLLMQSELEDNTPSCSLAEALEKQDLFINSTLANLGASLIWQMFREGMLSNRGFFVNLKDFRVQPLKVA